jgi:hypothetical protein
MPIFRTFSREGGRSSAAAARIEGQMKKANRWKHGVKHFVLPVLPPEMQGRHGCRLYRMTFDSTVGEEICAVYLEQPDYVGQFSRVLPFELFAHKGLVRTPHGIVAFIVWQIAANSSQEVMVEQYLNPREIGTIQLIASAANQTHFKLLVINNQSGEVAAFIDFENAFEFDWFVSAMAMANGHEPEADFPAAAEHVMNTIGVPELLVRSAMRQE